MLRPGDQRTRLQSYADTWEPVGDTIHGLSVSAARKIYSPHNAEGKPDPLYFRRACEKPAPAVTILDEMPAAQWRQLTAGEVIQVGDEVTARPTDDLQAPAGSSLWIAHRADDPCLGKPVPARTPCRYRRKVSAS